MVLADTVVGWRKDLVGPFIAGLMAANHKPFEEVGDFIYPEVELRELGDYLESFTIETRCAFATNFSLIRKMSASSGIEVAVVANTSGETVCE